MTDVADRKRTLRTQAAARRDGLDAVVRSLGAWLTARHVLDFLPDDQSAVAAYLAIRSEVDTAFLLAMLRQGGRAVGVPAIEEGELRFRNWAQESALEPQGFGTLAPGRAAAEILPAVILVPLLAFDAQGRRLGYGRGFYDRAIRRARDRGPVRAVGLAFAAQQVERVPTDEHDELLDAVVTENGVLVPTATASSRR